MKYLGSILTAATLLSAGCAGELDAGPILEDGTLTDPNEPPLVAPQSSEEAFAPIAQDLQDTCGNGGCHAGGTSVPFLPATGPATMELVMQYQTQLLGNPLWDQDTATLYTYGDGRSHAGGTFNYQMGTTSGISAWFAVEKAAPTGGGGGAPQPSAMQIWSGCMDLTDWENRNVAGLWANKGTNGNADCIICHASGRSGFLANVNDQEVFDFVTQYPSYMAGYFSLDPATGEVIVAEQRLTDVGQRKAPNQSHPAYSYSAGNANNALEAFYADTKARLDAGTCGPPRF